MTGHEVTNVRTGVGTQTAFAFSARSGSSIKSSGFEAEYGGATGGVINVVTKGGSNDWRGEFGAVFRPSGLNALGRPGLFLNAFEFPPVAEYFPERRDNYYEFNPIANLGGPILKDRVWFRVGYNPQIFKRKRLIDYVDPIDRDISTFPAQLYLEQIDDTRSSD